ncbi:MAG: hypothetical protein PVF15_02120 [Candidatus Bathyarchaeota archaeon]|jgi:hypothetical protein
MEAMDLATRLILGHLPFVGVSYESEKKDEEYRKRFSKMSTTKSVVEAAVKTGVRRFAAATPHSSSLASLHLEVLQLMIDEGHDIELLPCIEIPIKLGSSKVDPIRRWATYANLEGRVHSEVKQRMVDDPILNFREDWKRRLPASKPYEKEDFKKIIVDWNLIGEDLEFFADLPISCIEFGSETDFLAMTDRFDLIGELVDRAEGYDFKRVLLGVHHGGTTIPLLDNKLDGIHGYVTPINPLGVMMFPTKLSAERSVRKTEKAVYAIKPLAGGRASPKRAFTYVFDFDVESCMIGVASVTELKEDIKAAIDILEDVTQKR